MIVMETEVGYQFVREHWGKGLATEAAIAVRDYGFHVLGRNRMISLIRPDNQSSINVAMRNGMKKE